MDQTSSRFGDTECIMSTFMAERLYCRGMDDAGKCLKWLSRQPLAQKWSLVRRKCLWLPLLVKSLFF